MKFPNIFIKIDIVAFGGTSHLRGLNRIERIRQALEQLYTHLDPKNQAQALLIGEGLVHVTFAEAKATDDHRIFKSVATDLMADGSTQPPVSLETIAATHIRLSHMMDETPIDIRLGNITGRITSFDNALGVARSLKVKIQASITHGFCMVGHIPLTTPQPEAGDGSPDRMDRGKIIPFGAKTL